MAVSLNDLLRMQSRQGSPSTSMTLSYTPEPRTGELPPQPTPKAGMAPTYVPGGETPPEVFPQQTDPSDYARSSLRAQLQVDDPSSPANAMSALARKWYDWRTAPTTLERALDPRKMRFDAFGRETPAAESPQTLPFELEEGMPGSPGNLAGAMRRRLPSHLPGRVRSAIEDIIDRLTEQAKTPGLTPKGQQMKPIALPTPRVDWLEEFYRRGQHEPPWYAGSPQAFERFYGDLSPLSLGFNAAASMNATPYAQIDLANEGLRRLVQSGFDPSALRRMKPPPGETLDQMKGLGQVSREMEQMAKLWLKDRNADLTSVFNPKTFKRTDYHDVMAGKRHAPVIDTHMGRIGYGLMKPIPPAVLDLTEIKKNQWAWDRAKSGTEKAGLQYRMVADIGNILAAHHGVHPETWQGRVWVPWRQQFRNLGGSEPLAEMLEVRGRRSKDYQYLVQSGVMKLLPQAVQREVTAVLGMIAAGGGAASLAGREPTPPQ